MRAERLALPLVLLLALAPLSAFATFSDVPSSYPHAAAINGLTDRGIVNGNPDGTFKPQNPIDRASILKLLYKAANLTPSLSAKKCFGDVVTGAWYESFVCDAVQRGYVKGYEDKTFKPGKPVTRAEAIKLTTVILGIAAPEKTASVPMYTDVTASDWFYAYVRTAIARTILPIAGQNGKEFMPNKLLERGEAAAYIWNALQVSGVDEESSAQSSAAAQNSSAGMTQREQELKAQQAQEAALQAEAQKNTFTMNFPFNEPRQFKEKLPIAYRFTLKAKTVVDIAAALDANEKGTLSCRLYRLKQDGFSSEYYLGFVDGSTCMIRAALGPADYQLQLQPTTANVRYTVSAKSTTGDGNDGFVEAKALLKNKIKVDTFTDGDLEDWYTFKVSAPSDSQGVSMTVNATSSTDVGCIIYPLDDVDLFGFSGPQCGQAYLFPSGSYMVNVRHGKPFQSKQTYSVELK